jgi:hypothetical protein
MTEPTTYICTRCEEMIVKHDEDHFECKCGINKGYVKIGDWNWDDAIFDPFVGTFIKGRSYCRLCRHRTELHYEEYHEKINPQVGRKWLCDGESISCPCVSQRFEDKTDR